MGEILAIHWSPTTHGTWLHGDARGSWRNGQLIGADPFLEAETRARLRSDAVILSDAERVLIAEVFGATLLEKGHHVLAATVQATHCHLIFAPFAEEIKNVVARLKYRSACAVLKRRREDTTQRVGLLVFTLAVDYRKIRDNDFVMVAPAQRDSLRPAPQRTRWPARQPIRLDHPPARNPHIAEPSRFEIP
jgi:hypothetical protein